MCTHIHTNTLTHSKYRCFLNYWDICLGSSPTRKSPLIIYLPSSPFTLLQDVELSPSSAPEHLVSVQTNGRACLPRSRTRGRKELQAAEKVNGANDDLQMSLDWIFSMGEESRSAVSHPYHGCTYFLAGESWDFLVSFLLSLMEGTKASHSHSN